MRELQNQPGVDRQVHARLCFLIGSERIRFPVASKIALQSAGTEDPQQGHVRGDVHGGRFPIDGEGDGHGGIGLRVDAQNRQNLIVRSLLPNPQAGSGKRWYP